ncbi:MAG: winged helix-turn-helix domain-containing protein [Paracoccaceae bacterium]
MQQWCFDKPENTLISGGKVVQITPRASAVLDCLLRNKGKTVNKTDILSEVWPGLHVTEDLVREYIFDLRTALGDDARAPIYIETLRGRGFRLIGNIVALDAHPREPMAMIPGNGASKATIAVLRPIDLNGDTPSPVLSEKLAQEMISGLASHRVIEVVSRQSSFAVDQTDDLRDVATHLGADYLLESAIETDGNTLRATFHMIEGQSGRHVWAQRMSAQNENTQRALEELVTRLVNTLAGWHGEVHLAEFKLASRKAPDTLSAFDHFIRGCDLELNFDTASVLRSLQHFDRSLELDPSFARCWVMKAIMLQWSYDVFETKDNETLKTSAQAMEKAFILDPSDPVTLALIALQRARNNDMSGASDAISRAQDKSEADADACVCIATAMCVLEGDFSASELMFDKAIQINPAPPGWYRFVEARIRFFFGQYERSIAASVSGPQRVSAIAYRCLSQTMLGQSEAALISYEALQKRYPSFDFGFYADYFPIRAPQARARFDDAVCKLVRSLKDKECG